MRMSKRRFKQWISLLATISLLTTFSWLVLDFLRFPECYMPTWRHALECDIQNGKADAIEYYERVYIANEKYLFGEGE